MNLEEIRDREIAQEEADNAHFLIVLAELVEAARPLWRFGDGYGGMVYRLVREALDEAHGTEPIRPRLEKKRKLGQATRTLVFERDRYRCRACGDWNALSVDHVVPEARGGSDDLGNLQTLCRRCNSSKGVR